MNKYLRRIISVALAIMMVFAITAQFSAATIYNYNGFMYSVTSNTTADLHGRAAGVEDADLVIPKEFNEHYITNIVDSAFKDDENIQTLSCSKAILLERIGYYAFENCVNLSGNIYIGGRINEVGTSAFQGCSSLESVMYRNNLVTVISDQCFYNCSSLSYVELPGTLKKIEKFAFANTALTEINIPDSVTSIDSTAFSGCDDLVIYCTSDSYAHEFAEENQINHVLVDVNNGYYLGDTDNNKYIDVLDVTYIQRSLAYMEIPEQCDLSHSNIDGDDIVSSTDCTLISRYLAGLKSDYSVGIWIDQYEKHEF